MEVEASRSCSATAVSVQILANVAGRFCGNPHWGWEGSIRAAAERCANKKTSDLSAGAIEDLYAGLVDELFAGVIEPFHRFSRRITLRYARVPIAKAH